MFLYRNLTHLGIHNQPNSLVMARFGTRRWTWRLLLSAKFQLDWQILLLRWKTATIPWHVTTLGGSCTHPPSPSRAWDSTLMVHFIMPNFPLIYTYCCPTRLKTANCVALGAKKSHIWPYFKLQPSVMARPCVTETKLNVGVKLQTFLYPTASKSFLTSNSSMAITCSWTLPFKSMTDKQTQIWNSFASGGVQKTSPTILSMMTVHLENRFWSNVQNRQN